MSTDPIDPNLAPGLRRRVPWWCSWPVIVVLELICFIPAVILLWQRPLTSTKAKWFATAVLAGIPLFATVIDYLQPLSADFDRGQVAPTDHLSPACDHRRKPGLVPPRCLVQPTGRGAETIRVTGHQCTPTRAGP